jgi:rhodanese-related sulfurtransferase
VFVFLTVVLGFSSSWASSNATVIDAITANSMLERGVVFVDVRSAIAYQQGHIPGAINIDVRKGNFATEFAMAVKKDQEVVIYCRGRNCSRSPEAILIISPLGYEKIFHFKEGTPGWTAAGFELVK